MPDDELEDELDELEELLLLDDELLLLDELLLEELLFGSGVTPLCDVSREMTPYWSPLSPP